MSGDPDEDLLSLARRMIKYTELAVWIA